MNVGQIIGPYSLLLLAIVLLIIVAVVLFHNRPRPVDILAFAGIVIGLLAVYFYIRPVETPLMGEAANVRAMIGNGKPVLLEFQSPYCIVCTMDKPKVDAAEKEYAGKLTVIRVNIQDEVGRELASVYNFEYTPTFIFFDEQGHEVWRLVGNFDAAKLQQEMSTRN